MLILIKLAIIHEKVPNITPDTKLIAYDTRNFLSSLFNTEIYFFIPFSSLMFLIWHRDMFFLPLLTLPLVWLIYPTNKAAQCVYKFQQL
jgi:hypothetical protein